MNTPLTLSIITPAWNVGPWLPQTIESILSQKGAFHIQYIVVTDPSTDDTVTIAKEYQRRVESGTFPIACEKVTMRVIELEGSGSMYRALDIGFSHATGDIEAWMPGDDIYAQGAFETMRIIFTEHQDIHFVKGYDGTISEGGEVLQEGANYIYHQKWIERGVYGMEAYHVQQESVFWRPWLRKKVGTFPQGTKSMGDYWLWTQFAKHARLWSVDTRVSYFRKRSGQDSRVNAKRCRDTMWAFRGKRRPLAGWHARLLFFPLAHLIPAAWRDVFERLYPYLYPRHDLRHLTMEDTHAKIVTARTFVTRR
ncbi:MAG: hypothetical protein RLZZ234_382 [Candidatus Parcubacteria bacterium]|jgi:glycosyltransferase involved in cell wall biosynthesis